MENVSQNLSLSQALKTGTYPMSADPVDVVLVAFNDNLHQSLVEHISVHHQVMRTFTNPEPVRRKFRLICDFTEHELERMADDLAQWTGTPLITTDMNCSIYGDCKPIVTDSILKSLRHKKINKPVDDITVTSCYSCHIEFGFLNRKHHCRSCGRIFCYACSKWSEYVPNDLIRYSKSESWVKPGTSSRVCQCCRDMIINYRRIEKLVKYFEIVAYPIELCIKASTLCRDWRDAMRIYLSNVRDIQFSVPSAELTPRDIRFIKSNLHNIQGHNKWMLQALKLGLTPLTMEKTTPCNIMLCDKHCHHELTRFDAIIILNTPIYNLEVKLFALQILDTEPLTSDIAIFLPIEEAYIQDYIIDKNQLFNDFFWLSRSNKGLSSDIFRNKLLIANAENARDTQESLTFISHLEQLHSDIPELAKRIQSLKFPFVGPFGLINSIDYEITAKRSATKPLVIKYLSEGKRKALMYKREDIRKDAHIIMLVKIMYNLICESMSPAIMKPTSMPINIAQPSDLDMWFNGPSPLAYSPLSFMSNIRTPTDTMLTHRTVKPELASYRVLPIDEKSGFIEIVPNSATLYEILSRGTISNYIYRNNGDRKVSDIMDNYSASLAFWTVVTYILGVGDRHMENIMIRDDGVLFHIDYGFVFGADATSSYVRLDANLIEGLGGPEMYEPYKKTCCDIYCCLRRHFNIICACLYRLASIQPPIEGYNITPEFIETFVTTRFMLGQTEDEARIAFANIIDVSRENIINRVSDVIHSTVSSLKVGFWNY